MKQRWPFLLIAGVLLAWAGYLALGAALSEEQPAAKSFQLLKPLIILGSMGVFLLFWWLVFVISAKRRSQPKQKPPQNPG